MQSYVTEDNVYCVNIAPDEATVRKHAEFGGFWLLTCGRVTA
jgi:hypothetical protein